MKDFLKVTNLFKQYPGTLALDDVSCEFEQGKVHALLGKNGSGKSTLANVVSGIVNPTKGNIYLNGAQIFYKTPQEAIQAGVSVVHQEMSLIPALSVAENIFLGKYIMNAKSPKIIDWKKTEQATEEILTQIGIDHINPKSIISSLSIGQHQQIEIAKAISDKPKLLILDEPTSALAVKEVDILFLIMKKLKENGVTMIYISHRLQELSQIADTVTVLRDGKYIGNAAMKDVTSDKILEMMFGRISKQSRSKTGTKENQQDNKVVLQVSNLSRKPFFKNINFSLYQGEILGIAGLMGSGRTEMLKSIFGLDSYDEGHISVVGTTLKKITPEKMKNLGISYVPEDRKEEGLVQILSSHDNMILAPMKNIAYKKFLISKRMEDPYSDKQIQDLNIKLANKDASVSFLSGGNQQKVVVGNWLNTNPKIMFFDEPSRGIDVEAKQQIFSIMWEQKKLGVSTIMISSELEELHLVCDRILVLKNGGIAEVVKPDDITTNDLYQKCMT